MKNEKLSKKKKKKTKISTVNVAGVSAFPLRLFFPSYSTDLKVWLLSALLTALEKSLALLNELESMLSSELEKKSDSEECDTTTEDGMLQVLKKNTHMIEIMGDPSETNPWSLSECGDGNLNFVFRVQSKQSDTSIVVKKAPPYVRVIGPSYSLSEKRVVFETSYLQRASQILKLDPLKMPEWPLPKLIFTDLSHGLFAMEDLKPMIVWRSILGLHRGKSYDLRGRFTQVGTHVGCFIAQMLFKTSDLHLNVLEKARLCEEFESNTDLLSLTETFVFCNPYFECDSNRRKLSDDDESGKEHPLYQQIRVLRNDKKVKNQVFTLRRKFRCNRESLLHCDLHTGSIMVNETRTAVFDSEFARVGPMAFELGLWIGNCVLAVYAPLISNDASKDHCREYMKQLSLQIEQFWDTFQSVFLRLWKEEVTGLTEGSVSESSLYPNEMHDLGDGFESFMNDEMKRIERETLQFAAAVMIRRVISLASIPEFDQAEKEHGSSEEGTDRKIVEASVLSVAHWMLTAEDGCNVDTLLQKLDRLCDDFTS